MGCNSSTANKDAPTFKKEDTVNKATTPQSQLAAKIAANHGGDPGARRCPWMMSDARRVLRG